MKELLESGTESGECGGIVGGDDLTIILDHSIGAAIEEVSRFTGDIVVEYGMDIRGASIEVVGFHENSEDETINRSAKVSKIGCSNVFVGRLEPLWGVGEEVLKE